MAHGEPHPGAARPRDADQDADGGTARGRHGTAEDPAARAEARADVDRAKRALGERGPVWWDDGAPDLNRRLARNTVYAAWFAAFD